MRLRTRWIPLACVMLAAAACADSEPRPRTGGTAVIGAASDLDAANPLVTVDAWTTELMRFGLFTPLVRYGPGLEYEPYLAESWELTGDTGVILHLRDDVRWHDGEPTTAYDVLFTYERATDPATGFANPGYFARWTGAEVVDSFTIRFSWEPHAEPMAGLPFTPPVPRHLLDTVPAGLMKQAAFNRHPVGNGPFRFVSQRTNDRWVFEANPDFPEALGGRPRLDRLVWRVIPESSAQVTEIQSGEADLVLQPRPEQVLQLDERSDLRGIVKPSRQFSFIAWNGKKPPLGRADVRHALALGIDRQSILDGLRKGLGNLAVGPIGPFHWSYDPEDRAIDFDPDSARANLDQAGIRDTDGDGIRELEDGSDFAIEIKVPASSDFIRDVAEVVREDLAGLGIDASVRPIDLGTLFDDVTSTERRFDAFILSWNGDFRLDLIDLFHSQALDGAYQFASYSNPEVDSLMDAAAAEPDRATAVPMWRRVQRILREEQPWTTIYYQTDAFLMRERLRGVEMDIRGALLTLPEWWVDRDADNQNDTSEVSDSNGE